MAVSESLELAAYMGPYGTQHHALTLATLGAAAPEPRWTWPIDSNSRVTSVALSPDATFVIVTKHVVATGRAEPGPPSMVVLDARSRAPNVVKNLPGKSFVLFASPSEALAFDGSKADGSKLVIVSLKNWAESPVDTSQLRSDAILSAAVSRDGRRLALVGRAENGPSSNSVRVFEWPGMKRVTAQLPHLADVTNLSFNADGDSLLISTSDGTTHVWDVVTEKETLRIPAPGRQSTRAIFTRTADIAILDDSGLTVLPSHPDGLVNEACRRISRNLTPQEWAGYVGSGIAYQKTCPSRP